MQGHEVSPPVGPRPTPGAERAVLLGAAALMLGGAVLMLADIVSAGMAIPLIAVGIALVAIEQAARRRRR